MNSPDVWEILKGWKQDQLGIFISWVSSQEGVWFSFEGHIVDVDEEAISIIGEPSERVKDTPSRVASLKFVGAHAEIVELDRMRFVFDSGAILDLRLS